MSMANNVAKITEALQFLHDNQLLDPALDVYKPLVAEVTLALTLVKFGGEEAGIAAITNIMCYMYYCGWQKAKEKSILPWVVGEGNE